MQSVRNIEIALARNVSERDTARHQTRTDTKIKTVNQMSQYTSTRESAALRIINRIKNDFIWLDVVVYTF